MELIIQTIRAYDDVVYGGVDGHVGSLSQDTYLERSTFSKGESGHKWS